MITTEIIPVIHVLDLQQTLINIKICNELDIKKIFLITHHISNDELIDIAKTVKTLNPDLWIGINLLGFPTDYVLNYQELEIFNGIWSDGTVTEQQYNNRSLKNLLYFGALAFKYQKQPSDLKLACEESILTNDVSTTSGSGTGLEASDVKINSIREYLGGHPMAIASGVSIDNIHKYSGKIDYLLVASSITGEGELINKEKLRALLDKNGGL